MFLWQINFLQVGTLLENLLYTALLMFWKVMCAVMSAGQFAEQLPPQHLLLQDCIVMLLHFLFIQWQHYNCKGKNIPRQQKRLYLQR